MAETSSANLESTLKKPQVVYRCKKCRRIVAAQENIVTHERGKGESCFKWKSKGDDNGDKQVDCTSIFVEPMKWMEAVQEGYLAKKLQCMGCNARLGYFNWAGMQCSCGAWVNPAFQIQKCRIDECHL